jgi:Ca2+-binding RTX toxin-like protein
MPFPIVKSKILWRSPTNNWTLAAGPNGVVTDVLPGNVTILEGFLQAAYASPTAAALMDAAAATGAIRIGISVSGQPGMTAGYYNLPGAYIGFNLTAIDQLYYFNKTGVFVHEIPAITIAHEFIHFVLGATYADPIYNVAAMNGPNYKFDDLIITEQNKIAVELGLLNNIQVSYYSFIMSTDARWPALIVNQSYTDNNVVDVVRHGDDQGIVTSDMIDHTARTADLRDLIFGFGGDDTIKTGKGEDYVYGGPGNDKIWGGDDKDVLVGEAGDDEFHGEKGDDIIWGGLKDVNSSADGETDVADYSAAPAAISVTFAGTIGLASITIKDGEGGTDTLHSVEKIIGSSRHDQFKFSGLVPYGSEYTIDAGGGGELLNDVLNLLDASHGMTITNAPGGGTLTSGGTGVIHLVNFHTDIIGSPYDDEITDDASGPKSIDGGAGDDKISVSIGAATIRGGDGDDELSGGEANDVLVGGSGENKLEGKAGSDILIVSSDGDVADGGEGSDMLIVTATAESGATVVLRGGAGDDVIDARAHAGTDPFPLRPPYWEGEPEVILEFRAGDGHDVLLGSGYFDPAPSWIEGFGTPTDPGKTWGPNRRRWGRTPFRNRVMGF